jgi:hypothetical protein
MGINTYIRKKKYKSEENYKEKKNSSGNDVIVNNITFLK